MTKVVTGEIPNKIILATLLEARGVKVRTQGIAGPNLLLSVAVQPQVHVGPLAGEA